MTFIRFTNQQVLTQMESVLEMIKEKILDIIQIRYL
ncbi:MAG: hypothetical protein HY063_11745 [Bacteroidetes bacterium]|nr:hypothetical protein [Bacteroidota bacterium]